jgi:hypothetical protein
MVVMITKSVADYKRAFGSDPPAGCVMTAIVEVQQVREAVSEIQRLRTWLATATMQIEGIFERKKSQSSGNRDSISSRINVPTTPITPSATKNYDRATDAHFQPDKPSSATGKSLIVLNPSLTLNQRVPGSSPGAPTKQDQALIQDC